MEHGRGCGPVAQPVSKSTSPVTARPHTRPIQIVCIVVQSRTRASGAPALSGKVSCGILPDSCAIKRFFSMRRPDAPHTRTAIKRCEDLPNNSDDDESHRPPGSSAELPASFPSCCAVFCPGITVRPCKTLDSRKVPKGFHQGVASLAGVARKKKASLLPDPIKCPKIAR